MDVETDALIQKAIRVSCAHATVLTIAHRLETILDYDRIIVLSAGQVPYYNINLLLVVLISLDLLLCVALTTGRSRKWTRLRILSPIQLLSSRR